MLNRFQFSVNICYVIFYTKKKSMSGAGRPGAALFLAILAVFASCEQPAGKTGGNTECIRITGIPDEVGERGRKTYKIFALLSEGMDASAGYVAKGETLYNGRNSALIDLFDPDGQPWTGKGSFNLAIVLSPASVESTKDIDVYANRKGFSSQVQSFMLGTGSFMDLNTFMPTRVQQIYDGADSGSPGVICDPGSGIDYPGKPSP
jgi:hypothetical protein